MAATTIASQLTNCWLRAASPVILLFEGSLNDGLRTAAKFVKSNVLCL